MNKAASKNDPLERLKLVITACLSSFLFTNTFLKPVIKYFFFKYDMSIK